MKKLLKSFLLLSLILGISLPIYSNPLIYRVGQDLDAVADRGATTDQTLIVGGITTTGTIEGATLTEGGNAVYSAGDNQVLDWTVSVGTIHTGNYIENISTTLEAGTVNATTYGITSDGGADDIVLPEADTDNAGLLGADKWAEIVANSLKETNTDSQNLWETIATDGDSVTANSSTDTLTIAGGGIIGTSQSGDTITITGTEADNLDTVSDRGATTDQILTVGGLISIGSLLIDSPTFYVDEDTNFVGIGTVTPDGPLDIITGLITFSEGSVSPDTACHQGYTTDGTYHYTIHTDKIYKRNDDGSWTEDSSNADPFNGISGNHLGDGDYYNGKLYLPGETWVNCGEFSNQQILVFDAGDLSRDSATDISAQGHEVASLVVVPEDGDNGIIYMVSFCDGTKIWKYDLSDFSYLGNIELNTTIFSLQGITYKDPLFYVSGAIDKIYSINKDGRVNFLYTDITGGIREGVDYSQAELRWLIDNGPGEQKVHFLDPTVTTKEFIVSSMGKVGIGIVTPIVDLHISDSGIPTLYIASSTDGGDAKLRLAENLNGVYYGFEFVYDGGYDQLQLWSKEFGGNDAVRVTFKKDGDVDFHAGDITTTGTLTSGGLVVNTSGDGAEILKFNIERPWVFRQVNAGANTSLDLHSTASDKGFLITSLDGKRAAEFRVSNTANDNKVFLVPDGGNVGIGTATPDETLEIVGGVNTRINLDGGDNAGILIDRGAADRRTSVRFLTAGLLDRVMGMVDSDIGTATDFFIGSNVDGADPDFLIDINGKVGIGTDTPKSILHLNNAQKDGIVFNLGVGTDQTQIEFLEGTLTNAVFALRYDGALSTPNNLLKIMSAPSTDGVLATTIMTFTQTGKVGIGTTNPGRALVVSGTDPILDIIATDSGRNMFLNPGAWRLVSNGDLRFTVSNTNEAMRILANGRVGIGTTNPQEALDLNDGNLITTGVLSIGNTSLSSPALTVLGGAGGATIVELSRGTATFAWALTGGRMAFNDVTAGQTALSVTGVGGVSQLMLGVDHGSQPGGHRGDGIIKGVQPGIPSTDEKGSDITIHPGQGRGSPTSSLFFKTPITTGTPGDLQDLDFTMTLVDQRVGIGTTDPQEVLDVVGGALVSGTLSADSLIVTGGKVRSSTANYRVYYHADLFSLDPGVSGATYIAANGNSLAGWQMTAAGHDLHFETDLHSDWDGASDLVVEIRFDINAASNLNDTVDIKVVAVYKGIGEISTKTQTVEVAVNVGDGGGKAQYYSFEVDIPIDYNIGGGNNIEAMDEFSFTINLETDTSEIDDIILTSISTHYNTTHIGMEDIDID